MSENQWTMFNWSYGREPGTHLYNGSISTVRVVREGDLLQEEEVGGESFQKACLEWMLEALSLKLQRVEGLCKVTVFLKSRAEGQETKVWELDNETVDMIRHNLPGAINMWVPRHVTVHVKPFVPSLSQEKVNAES